MAFATTREPARAPGPDPQRGGQGTPPAGPDAAGDGAVPDQSQEAAAPSRPSPHQVAWVAAGLARVAREAGVGLPSDYLETLVSDGLGSCPQVGLSRLGDGVVIHTVPDGPDRLPVLLGYADRDGCWHRDGRRYRPGTPADGSENPEPCPAPDTRQPIAGGRAA